MQLHFISVHKLAGISKLEGADPRLVWESTDAKAYLTAELSDIVEHADRASAVIHGLMLGMFGQAQSGSLEERLQARVTEIREERAKKHANAVFLVFHGTKEVDSPIHEVSRDAETFTVAFDAIDKKAVFNEYLPELLRALAAVVIGLDFDVTAGITKITEMSYLFEPSTARPTYSVTATVGPITASLARPLSELADERIGRNVDALKTDAKITRILDQFVQSLTGDFDEFRSFLSAWNALEIFVSSSFKETYSDQWFERLRAAAPKSAAGYFDHVEDVMSRLHRLGDKFMVIASLLNDSDANTDIATFRKLKKRRDDVSHGADDPAFPYPVHETQQLLRKYLALHLAG